MGENDLHTCPKAKSPSPIFFSFSFFYSDFGLWVLKQRYFGVLVLSNLTVCFFKCVDVYAGVALFLLRELSYATMIRCGHAVKIGRWVDMTLGILF